MVALFAPKNCATFINALCRDDHMLSATHENLEPTAITTLSGRNVVTIRNETDITGSTPNVWRTISTDWNPTRNGRMWSRDTNSGNLLALIIAGDIGVPVLTAGVWDLIYCVGYGEK